jgi:hypothetical protein
MNEGMTPGNIERDFDLLKGKKTGYYTDTAENRAKFRVGQKYSKDVETEEHILKKMTTKEHDTFLQIHLQGHVKWGRTPREKRVDILLSLVDKGYLDEHGDTTDAGRRAAAPVFGNLKMQVHRKIGKYDIMTNAGHTKFLVSEKGEQLGEFSSDKKAKEYVFTKIDLADEWGTSAAQIRSRLKPSEVYTAALSKLKQEKAKYGSDIVAVQKNNPRAVHYDTGVGGADAYFSRVKFLLKDGKIGNAIVMVNTDEGNVRDIGRVTLRYNDYITLDPTKMEWTDIK